MGEPTQSNDLGLVITDDTEDKHINDEADVSPSVIAEEAKTNINKLQMPLKDAIVALEFDYYVLGVALFRLFTTVGFCVIFAVLINSGTPNEKMYTQSNAVSTALAPGSNALSNIDTTVQFQDIDSVEDVYDWLTDTFIPTVFVTTDHTGKILPDYQLGHLDLANRVLGGVILEMTPREYEPCDDEFVLLQLYPMCTYVDDSAKTTTFLTIDYDAIKAKAAITSLKQSGTWVNYHSRQLAITVATYSGEVSVFTVTRLKIDFLQTGSIEVESTTNSIPDYRGRTWVTIIPVVGVYIVFGWILRRLENARAPVTASKFTALNVAEKQIEMQAKRTTRFRTLARKYLPLAGEFCVKFGALPAFAALWTVTISLDFDKQLIRLSNTNGKGVDEKYHDTTTVIHALDIVAAWTNALSIVGAIAVFQLGLYTIRQLSFHPQLNVFARTVGNSLRQFRDFFLVFLIIFITFSFMGNLLFGDRVREFSTGTLSRESCMNMLFGTFEFSTIYYIRGSGWFYWGYMIIVSLILLNMMLAIVMGTYKAMSKEGYQGEINVMLASRISTIHRYLVQFVLKRKGLPLKHPARTKPGEDNKQGLRDFEAMKMDICKLEHDDVIAYGKFRPPLLLLVLQTKQKQKQQPSPSSAMTLTPAFLRQLFPLAAIKDDEIVETFKFLREGFELNEAVTKQGQQKKNVLLPGTSKMSRLAELQRNLDRLMEEINATHKEIQSLGADKAIAD
ncbi:unnamed protein product [Phytophthora lilii]|uniref:Unnamed protein product n=1 Tax=Phytophthora lilii TaxID=2077276 RepID=A0A9W6TE86_9STRA|nr:unnamed protein product [Phytophthora lilii]